MRSYLAKQYVRLYSQKMFIGVSGSTGKSTTVKAVSAVLEQKYKDKKKVLASKPGSNWFQNVISTILKITPFTKNVVLEIGNTLGDVDNFLSLIKPQTLIFTKISVNQIEKNKLLENLGSDGIIILNWDDPNNRKLAEDFKGTVIFYGSDPQNCAVWAGNVKIENFRTSFELNVGVERARINYQLLGIHQIYPALAAAALGIVVDVPLTKIKFALESIEPVEHSLEIVPGPEGSILLDDTINFSPASLDDAIDTLYQIPARRRILVLGELKELRSFSEEMHRNIAQRIFKEKLDFVFLGLGDTQIIADELKSLGFWEDRLEANLQNSKMVGKLLKLLGKGDVCLIKGGRAVRLDEVVKRVAKK